MDIERLKEDIRNVEYELEYGEEEHLGRIAADVNCLRSVIDFANEAIARQSVKSEEVAEAIEYVESVKGYLNDVCDHQDPKTYDSLDLAITALQQMKPPKGG